MTASINIPVYSDALVVLGTAGIIVPLAKRWGLNPVLGYFAAGALLGPLGLGTFVSEMPLLYWFTVVDAKNVSGIADLGVVFLLFLIGLELSYDRLMAMRRLVFGLGGLQIVLSTLLIASVAVWSGERAPAAIIIGACLALSSTAIVLEVLSGEGRLKTTAGRASFAVLLAQDLAVIPILMFISILGANLACLAQVFISPRKASRLSRPSSERVPAEILRRVTWQRISFSEPLVCSGMSGRFSTISSSSFCARSRASSLSRVAKPVSVEKMASKRRLSSLARRGVGAWR